MSSSRDCGYRTNVYSSFNAHKNRKHTRSLDICDDIVSTEKDNSASVISTADLDVEGPFQSEHADTFDFPEFCDTSRLRAQLHRILSSLFLKMQTILHVSDLASQQIVDDLTQIFSLSQPLVKETLKEILQRHHVSTTEAVLNDLVYDVKDKYFCQCHS